MTKKQRFSYLLIVLAALVLTVPLSACKQPIVPTDQEITKSFQDNKTKFSEVAEAMLAEGNQQFMVRRNRWINYGGSDKPPVSEKTVNACVAIMTRTFCVGCRREGDTAHFIFFEASENDTTRSKALVYDKKEMVVPALAPTEAASPSYRATPIEEHWRVEYRYDKKGAAAGK